jgi:hypothetical protein
MTWRKKESRWKFEKASFQEGVGLLDNPGRGWYQIYSFAAEQQVDIAELQWCICKEESLALIRLNIGAYSNQPLSAAALTNIESVLEFFTEQKKDMILRFTYDLEGKGLEKEPAVIQLVEQHMNQLKNLLVNYTKYIFILQGLFVGNWGEMHGSKFLTDEKMQQLASTLWNVSGGETYLAVRKPVQWRALFHQSDKESQSKKTGLFNDGMFASETDLGTYGELSGTGWNMPWSREKELEFTGDVATHVPFGGEAVGVAAFSDLPSAVADMKQMHVSYLNRIHDVQVLDKWKQSTCTTGDMYQGMSGYDYVERHLGYRFVVRDVELAKRRGQTLNVTIENIGFANLYEETVCQLILMQDDQEKMRLQVSEDPRKWKSGSCTTIQLDLNKIQPESYQLYFQLTRIKDGRVIQFANENAKQMVYLGLLRNLD